VKITKIVLMVLVIIVMLAIPLAGCGSEPAETDATESQVFTVQRGNLAVDITAAGNLALSRTEDLTFEIAGTVEEVLVEEGDSVTEGQVLVRLDASEWEDELTILRQQLTTAERQLTTAERQLETKKRTVSSRELALLQEQIDLQTAEYNLGAISDIKEAQDAIDDAEYDLRVARTRLKEALQSPFGGDPNYWLNQIISAQARQTEAEQDLTDVLAGSSARVTTEVALEVATKQLLVEQARMDLEDAQIAIDNALKDVDDAQLDVEDAQQDVEDAQESLDEALISSTEIIAAFDGFITTVNVEGGDEVTKGTVAVVIADPTKFEADILVSEMDIMQVKTGGEASVQVDAMSGLTLPATVTHISPTATIQSGVVNYRVKVEIQPLESVMLNREQIRQEAAQNIQQGEIPEHLQQAIDEGRITQEQVDEMMKQGQQSQTPATMPDTFHLRQGLTVTVSVLIAQRTDVLLVPNGAITQRAGQSYIQLSKDGVIEERAITTGISSWQYTEVTDGLSEGDLILVPEGTANTSTTQQGRQGGMFIPGVGGHG